MGIVTDGLRSVRIVCRRLLGEPGFTVVVVGTLALGMGAATALFSLVHGTLLRPLPYAHSEELVQVRDRFLPTNGSGGMSLANYLDLKARTRSFEGFAAYSEASLNLAADGRPARIEALFTTHDFLRTLGVSPLLGRAFQEGEDGLGAGGVVVIGWGLWRDRFGGSGGPGKTLLLNGEPHTVVGVLPRDFWFPGDPDVLVPMNWNENSLQARGSRGIEGVARLREGVAVAAAEAELRQTFGDIAAEFPTGNTDWTVRLLPFEGYVFGGNRTAFALLSAAAVMLLLISCANVANLFLVRAERRQSEMAVRAAMGAGRGRIARHVIGEGLVLTMAASVIGMGIAAVATRALVRLYGAGLPRSDGVTLNLEAVAFAMGVGLLTGLAVSAVPALHVDLRGIYRGLGEGGARGGSSRPGVLQALVTAEVAIAVVLVTGAALLVHSAWRTSRIDTGVDLEDALVFQVQLPTGDREPSEIAAFYRRALAEIERLPDVEAVGITDRPPLQGGYNITSLPSPVDPEVAASFVEVRRVTPGFFPAAGIPLIEGRSLTEADGLGEASVVVISEVLARTLFPDGGAVGRFVSPGGRDFQVVGVVGSVRDFGVLEPPRPALYWPYPVPDASPSMTFVVRTTGGASAVVPALREVIRGVDASIPVHGVASLRDVARRTLGPRTLATGLFTTFGAAALFLAALGIFGVLAYSVEQRGREIGVRLALGARSERVVAMVVQRGMTAVVVGLAVGLGAVLALGSLLAGLLFEVESSDPTTLTAVAAIVLVTGVAAAWLPARRAAVIAPSRALRAD